MNQAQITGDDALVSTIGALSVAAVEFHETGSAHHAVLPPGYKLEDITGAIEAAEPNPNRKKGKVLLNDVASFTQYLTKHAVPASCNIYADPDNRTLVGVLNDHTEEDYTAGWRDHRAVYTAEYSREFALWLAQDGVKMEQEDFAVFLEDNIADVVEPSGEALLQVALTLQAKTEVNFKSHRRLDNGQVQFGYSENTSSTAGADGSLEIPREFTIGLRVFKHAPEGYRIKARLKYRLGAGKLKFWYELDRPANVVEDAFKGYVIGAQASGFTVLMGKP